MILEDINSNLLLIVDHFGLLNLTCKDDYNAIDKITSICNKLRHES